MSINVVTYIPHNTVPRFSDIKTVLFDKWSRTLHEKEFFCNNGHDFTIIYDTTKIKTILPIWECPHCETIALDHPSDMVNLIKDTQ